MWNNLCFEPSISTQIWFKVTILLTLLNCIYSAQSVFPDLSCHPGYNATRMVQLHEECTTMMAKDANIFGCHNKCMLSWLGIYYAEEDDDDQNLAAKSDNGSPVELHVLKVNVGWSIMADIIGTEQAQKLSYLIEEKCGPILEKIANKDKLPCDQWGPVYDCIKDAVKC